MRSNEIVAQVSTALEAVPGVAAVVLGGSRARGTASAQSDHDFGLYYEGEAPIDVAALQAAITPLVDDASKHAVTRIGEWGPWINGGAWLSFRGHKVDLLYRDLGRVRSMIDQGKAGRITMDYQPGHPHGFCSSIYMGEVATCNPLNDPRGLIRDLKAEVLPFPEALKAAIVGKFKWEVQFSIDNAALAVKRSDQSHVSGCTYRALCCLAQVLFAVNGRYLINEKAALVEAATFPLTIASLETAVASIWNAIGNRDFSRALSSLNALSEDLNSVLAHTEI
jgi:hypothetical protein